MPHAGIVAALRCDSCPLYTGSCHVNLAKAAPMALVNAPRTAYDSTSLSLPPVAVIGSLINVLPLASIRGGMACSAGPHR